jgi:hypothetical protein
MLNFVENLLENARDPRSGPMNDQDHSLFLSDPDRSLVLSHFLKKFLQNLATCHRAFKYDTLDYGYFAQFKMEKLLFIIYAFSTYVIIFGKK